MKTNIQTRKLISALKKAGQQVPLWKRIAVELEKSTRAMTAVNLDKISKTTKEREIALIPGKVLSVGNLTKKTTVAAFKFSEAAREKINKNGEAITIEQLLQKNPKGSKVRILK